MAKVIDAHLAPSYSIKNRAARALWGLVWMLLFRPSPRVMHPWRRWLLRIFGAKIGRGTRIYQSVRIWAPWNLITGESVIVGDFANVYNPARITLKSHAVISQEAYLCAASHDYEDPGFPVVRGAITVEPYGWICARSIVMMNVTVGEGAVLGIGSLATRSLEPWTVYTGVPAQPVKKRTWRGSVASVGDPCVSGGTR